MSCTRDVGQILRDLKTSFERELLISSIQRLVGETYHLFKDGFFDSSYADISRVAQEMPESFIYGTFGHIGQSIEEKHRRCSSTMLVSNLYLVPCYSIHTRHKSYHHSF